MSINISLLKLLTDRWVSTIGPSFCAVHYRRGSREKILGEGPLKLRRVEGPKSPSDEVGVWRSLSYVVIHSCWRCASKQSFILSILYAIRNKPSHSTLSRSIYLCLFVCPQSHRTLRLLESLTHGPDACRPGVAHLGIAYGQTAGVHNIFPSAFCECH